MKETNNEKKLISTKEVNKIAESTDSNQTDVLMHGHKVAQTKQQYATIIDYAELKRMMMQNVGKGPSKTYSQYTKEKLQQYIKNPLSNIDNIRDISLFIYRVNHNYKKINEYYSLMPLYHYNIIYTNTEWSSSGGADFTKEYQTVCKRVYNMNIPYISAQIISTALRDGIYVGYCYDDETTFFINTLEPKYCKISGITDKNTYTVKFDASYFDVGNNKEFLYGVEGSEEDSGIWDDIFIEGYETYKSNGNDFKWFELPPEKTMCIISGDDPLVPIPYFLPVFTSLLDLLDYEALIRSKTELENYVLLLSKIPMNKSDKDEVNNFAVSLDLVEATQSVIDEVVPDLVGTAFSPCDVEPIFFNNKNQVEDTNVYAQAVHNLMSSLGISEMIFNGEKSGSVGLAHSIQVDMTLTFELLSRIQSNIQRYINLNISENFEFYFHKMTYFNKEEYINSLKDAATLGFGKLDYATAVNGSPYRVMNSIYMENAFDINSLLQPLMSSYTTTGKEGGGQEKSDDKLSDEGAKTKEKNKNAGTKAKK